MPKNDGTKNGQAVTIINNHYYNQSTRQISQEIKPRKQGVDQVQIYSSGGV